MFTKVLIANRGEIACRVMQTARRMGIATVAVYSAADRDARHVRLADEALAIGAPAAQESYLVIKRLIDAALRCGAQAVHPGYGFLSENADFADACTRAGLVFIGPPAAAIRAMGSKARAKALMQAAGVPLAPGYHGENQNPVFLAEQAQAIGFPVLIKASAGGGGKGMRRVDCPQDFAATLAACQREARQAFGDDHVLVEHYVLNPRHIEIQVFGDQQGNCIHLFERDCSVQRRHQKVLEEAPAPGVSAALRARMGQAAVTAARAVGYVGAGTVEFIVRPDGGFYFMEMNTRLQVEHPVTEMITGIDLVQWQLRVAAGEPLPLAQQDLVPRGHAMEARIYAEDPDQGFLPATGTLIHYATPAPSPHVRVDAGVEQGDTITPYYDPLMAKLIVWGHDRADALMRLRQALGQYQLVGVKNNLAFLSRLATCAAFATADLDTALIERERAFLFEERAPLAEEVWLLAAVADVLPTRAHDTQDSPWDRQDAWRLNGHARRTLVLRAASEEQTVDIVYTGDTWEMTLGERSVSVRGAWDGEGQLWAQLGEHRVRATVIVRDACFHIFFAGRSDVLERVPSWSIAMQNAAHAGALCSPMPGKIIALLADPGAVVEAGAPLLVMEAMKMEHTISAPFKGVVKAFFCQTGEQVPDGVELIQLTASAGGG